ncbi:phosphate/phosphite/phosphonate ABC transporter substrate-binding protein [Denitrobaculum tricleocarpae]|uniref:Phosphate/phosphite/phosphonate ABC transporter substrate-binding protein n=1 Tax=Denitrobaculum tricleocarpae TaxID=2591009 RepID=A0A545TML1_9PROT|nr:phosphate/phosphite/phosphonate ABC transporter substrate-binding protein [Denitrobaculum tricleocarpae]
MRFYLLIAAVLQITLSTVGTAAADSRESFVFGIVPQQSASRLAQAWVPFMERLSDVSGYRIEFATAKDIPTFEACLAKGAYDIAYMNPYHYTVFHDLAGYQAIARVRDKRLRGILVARKDASLENLEHLSGNAVAFPSPAAFGASVIPRAELKARGIDISPNYVKSHDSVYRAVAAGLMPAGGGVMRTFNNVPADIRDQLKIVYRTDGYTPHAFAVSSRMNGAQSEALFEAMQQVAANDAQTLQPLGMKGFVQAANADWDDIRALQLTQNHTQIVSNESLQCHSG